MLLRPLVNRDEDRLIYIRQSAPGIGAENMTFSVPEVNDLKSRVTTISAFGDFSTVDFTMIGLGGEPRMVKAGVVGGSFFDVMGLRPVLGRLLNAQDDGPKAAGAAVLTHRFWTTSLNSDPAVIGKTIRLGPRTATVVGVLEPSVPYPADTEIIANVVTSPHHLGATMVTSRTHRMTELFGRLAPGASLEAARAELTAVHAAMMREHPEAYSREGQRPADGRDAPRSDRGAGADDPARAARRGRGRVRHCVLERRQPDPRPLGAPRRRAGRARRARRRPRRAPAHAAGREPGALRRRRRAGRGAGAAVRRRGRPLCRALLGSRARGHRRCERALGRRRPGDGRGRPARVRPAAAVAARPAGLGLASGSVRITPGTNRRLRVFATTQIAFSFVLLAGAGMLLATLVALQTANTGYNMRQVLAFDIPTSATGRRRRAGDRLLSGSDAAHRRAAGRRGRRGRAASCPGAMPAACLAFQFTVEGYTPADGEENPHARIRIVAPRFFAVLGVPMLAGRDFTDDDRGGSELVAIVSQSVAQRLFPNGDAVNRKLWWTDPTAALIGTPVPRRIVGVVADVDDENVVQGPALTVYHPVRQMGVGRPPVRACGRRSVRARAGGDARHPRDLRGPARGARRDARGRARGGAVARAAERLRVFRVCRHRAADRRRRRGGRAGVLGERAHARVRRAAGRRVRAPAPAGPRALGGRADCRDRDRGRRGGRLRARARGGEIFRARAAAGRRCRVIGAAAVLIGAAGRRVADAGGARLARGRGAGAPVGVATGDSHMTRHLFLPCFS